MKSIVIQLNGKLLTHLELPEIPPVKIVQVPIGNPVNTLLINILTKHNSKTYGVLHKSDGTQKFFRNGQEVTIEELTSIK